MYMCVCVCVMSCGYVCSCCAKYSTMPVFSVVRVVYYDFGNQCPYVYDAPLCVYQSYVLPELCVSFSINCGYRILNVGDVLYAVCYDYLMLRSETKLRVVVVCIATAVMRLSV